LAPFSPYLPPPINHLPWAVCLSRAFSFLPCSQRRLFGRLSFRRFSVSLFPCFPLPFPFSHPFCRALFPSPYSSFLWVIANPPLLPPPHGINSPLLSPNSSLASFFHSSFVGSPFSLGTRTTFPRFYTQLLTLARSSPLNLTKYFLLVIDESISPHRRKNYFLIAGSVTFFKYYSMVLFVPFPLCHVRLFFLCTIFFLLPDAPRVFAVFQISSISLPVFCPPFFSNVFFTLFPSFISFFMSLYIVLALFRPSSLMPTRSQFPVQILPCFSFFSPLCSVLLFPMDFAQPSFSLNCALPP